MPWGQLNGKDEVRMAATDCIIKQQLISIPRGTPRNRFANKNDTSRLIIQKLQQDVRPWLQAMFSNLDAKPRLSLPESFNSQKIVNQDQVNNEPIKHG